MKPPVRTRVLNRVNDSHARAMGNSPVGLRLLSESQINITAATKMSGAATPPLIIAESLVIASYPPHSHVVGIQGNQSVRNATPRQVAMTSLGTGDPRSPSRNDRMRIMSDPKFASGTTLALEATPTQPLLGPVPSRFRFAVAGLCSRPRC